MRLQGVWHLVVNTHLGLLINQPSVHVSALIPILTLLPPVPSFIIFLKVISIVPFLVGRSRRRSCNLIVDCKIIGERTTDVLPPCNLTGCLVLYQVPRVLLCGVLCPVLLVPLSHLYRYIINLKEPRQQLPHSAVRLISIVLSTMAREVSSSNEQKQRPNLKHKQPPGLSLS